MLEHGIYWREPSVLAIQLSPVGILNCWAVGKTEHPRVDLTYLFAFRERQLLWAWREAALLDRRALSDIVLWPQIRPVFQPGWVEWDWHYPTGTSHCDTWHCVSNNIEHKNCHIMIPVSHIMCYGCFVLGPRLYYYYSPVLKLAWD